MPGSTQIYCAVDAYNYLTIMVGHDLDIALMTERCSPVDEQDYVFMQYNPTLRVSRGHGNYDTKYTNDWKNEKTLHDIFLGFYNNDLKDAPRGLYLAEDAKAEVYTFPSDDGGSELFFNILNCADIIGVEAVQDDQDPVTVWLGNANDIAPLHMLWERSKATYKYNTQYNSAKGFAHMLERPVMRGLK